ncbi:MAG: BRCT domain-containing protein, partial [bacterium]
YNSIKTWVQRLRILHWGDALIKLLIDYELVSSLPDLYNLDWNFLGDLAGQGVAKRAKKSLEDKGQDIPFADFISALNIRFLDTKSKNLVAIGIDTPEKLLAATVDQLTTAEGIGDTKAVEIRKSLDKLKPVIERMGKIISFEEKSGPLAGLSFCFTGAMSRPRKELENMALDAGAEIKKSVSAGLTHLVMANPDSTTTKAQKARKLGTKCISEAEFKGMFS